MTDPTALLASSSLRVEPGGRIQTTLTVGNHSEVVEGFHLDVLGEQIAAWAEVTPTVLQVYPGQQATAVVAITPPAGTSAPSGTYPFAVRVRYGADLDKWVAAEGEVEVGRVFGLNPKITPVTSSGRWRGRHLVTLTNWGNAGVQLAVSASDPDERLAFLVIPDRLKLPVGASASTRVQVRTLRPYLRGAVTRLPFQVVAEPDPPEPIPPAGLATLPGMGRDRRATIDAAFQQKPILSRFIVTVATLLLLGGGGGVAWALTRPSSTSEAALGTTAPANPDLSAVALDSQSLRLTWNSQPLIDSYKLLPVTDDGGTGAPVPLDSAQTTHLIDGLAPGQTYCFRLQAFRGELSSLSAKSCAETPAAPTSATAPETTEPATDGTPDATTTAGATTVAPGGGETTPATTSGGGDGQTTPGGSVTTPPVLFTAQDFIAVVNVTVPLDATSLASTQQAQAAANEKLQGSGVTAEIMRTSDYPAMTVNGRPVVNPGYLVYLGPFPSAAQATDFCTNAHQGLGNACAAAQPQPAG